MIKTAVTISLIEQTRGVGPFVFQDDLRGGCEAARRLGFDAVELFVPGSQFEGRAELNKLLADNDLKVAAVGTGGGWLLHQLTLSSVDAGIRARAGDFVRQIVDLAGSLGAMTIVGSMQGRAAAGNPKDSAMNYLADALAILAEHAAQYRTPLLIEPLNRYETNLLNTLSDGVRLIDLAGSSNLRLLADLFHMNIEETQIDAALHEAADFVGHIHLADSNRRAGGFGHTDLASIASTLQRMKYSRYVSAEIFPLPTAEEAAAQTMRCYKQHFAF